jgi:hypothetical protein
MLASCSEDLPPGPEETVTNVVLAVYQSPEDFGLSPIELNGEPLDREWGGPLQPGRDYYQVRLSAAAGNGDPGPPRYVSMKSIYTEDDVFFLFRWFDEFPNTRKDFLTYVGPTFPLFEILCGPEYADTTVVRDTSLIPLPGYDEVIDCPGEPEPCDTFYVRETLVIDDCDTLQIHGCQEALVAEDSWVMGGEEDRLIISFEMTPAGDDLGTYAEQGCLVACHENESPAFGRPFFGKLDIWQWLASRTNTVRDLYGGRASTDNPNFPTFGTPGYLDDLVADPGTGLIADPGLAAYVPNFEPGSAVPKWVYRCGDDPFCEPEEPSVCFNLFGERCVVNNGLSMNFLWRESRAFERFDQFWECDTINEAPVPLGTEPRPWRFLDTAPGYLLTYPTDSRADVFGKGEWEDGIWTLEVGRALTTLDPNNDASFVAESGFEVIFTLALMDDAGDVHWGSEPQILRFGPKE